MSTDNNAQVENSLHLRQNELTQKYIKLQVLKDLSEENKKVIEQERELLKKETDALDKFHHKVWTLQNEMCDKVWDFSKKHDFYNILKHYPDPPSEFTLACDCEDNNCEVFQKQSEAENLLLEIQKLESALEIEACNFLKEDLAKAEKELQELEKEYTEAERSKSNINEIKQQHEAKSDKQRYKQDKNKSNKSQNSSISKQNTDDHISADNMVHSSSDWTEFDTNVEARNMCNFLPQNETSQKNNNNFKRKWSQINNKPLNRVSNFITASTYMKTVENQTQFKNTPSCEKIIAKAVSNTEKSISSTSIDQPRKKFIFKTKSLITQRHKH